MSKECANFLDMQFNGSEKEDPSFRSGRQFFRCTAERDCHSEQSEESSFALK
jgi:hypothetical protein